MDLDIVFIDSRFVGSGLVNLPEVLNLREVLNFGGLEKRQMDKQGCLFCDIRGLKPGNIILNGADMRDQIQ